MSHNSTLASTNDATFMAAHTRNAEAASSPRRLPHLYAHALESIFAFLPLADLATVLAVSREWSAAVVSMRRISVTVPASRFCSLLVSPSVVLSFGLTRHIGALGEVGHLFRGVQLDPPALSLLLRFPYLHTLVCRCTAAVLLQLSRRQPNSSVFPSTLTHLTLSLDSNRMGASASLNAALQVVASALPLLRSFQIRLAVVDTALAVSFAPFIAAPHLEEFGFDWPSLPYFPPSEAALRLDDPSTKLLCYLLRAPSPPVAAKLRSLGRDTLVNVQLSALLPSLPSLTELHGWLTDDAEPEAFLPRLLHLTRLELGLNSFHRDAVGSSNQRLQTALHGCVGLTALRLALCRLTSDDVYALLQRMPHLRELELVQAKELSSLRCFSTPPLCLSLQRLSLRGPSYPAPRLSSELPHLHALHGLTHLDLRRAFTDGQPTAESLALLQSPSLILPNLRLLEC
jgi:hypothetical protein